MDVLRTVCTIFSRAVVETMQNKTCQLEPVADEGSVWTVITIHHIAVKQVSDY